MPDDGAWNYRNPVEICFGWGRLKEINQHVQGRSLIVTSSGTTRRGLTTRVKQLVAASSPIVFDLVASNPTIEAAEAAVEHLDKSQVDTIIALGGGSSIDFAKVLAVTLANPDVSLRQALETPDLQHHWQSLTLVAVPTTAGTGSEVTPFATLWDQPNNRKMSLVGAALFAKSAILDPELTSTLSWETTLSPGLDAISQCFEAIWNRNSTPVTTVLARRGMSLAANALLELQSDLSSRKARSDMLEASLLSGLAISHTRTALAHSISYPLTAHFGVPHGLACSFSLPAVLEFNMKEDDGRLDAIAREFGCRDGLDLSRFLIELLRKLGVPEAFSCYVPSYASVYDVASEMITPDRAGNNIRNADVGAVRHILEMTENWMLGLGK